MNSPGTVRGRTFGDGQCYGAALTGVPMRAQGGGVTPDIILSRFVAIMPRMSAFRVVQVSDTHLSRQRSWFVPNFQAMTRIISGLQPALVVNFPSRARS
jgi:hypothetical protein